ncbi:MAG: bifunctional N(6)-L-threonylcarbamoyladenine synthase/serine/threonine protein kinase [Candidatus Lokiarchaeota archaeon]|nr:bifunctional N(6)-L-threonylcarbamoyladenine synthase/serine/threonine protein kinase [Candidatus Lokiarchaeota archaeon]
MRYCLGIESTAHTFSVGIVDFEGDVLAVVNDTYVPKQGGLHPRKVVEHHNNVFLTVINSALDIATLSLNQIDLISFSQSPGLGPCLRIGAAVARTLAQKLKIPLVGVNHCIGHIEIGRKFCKSYDPLTLYVSGGNTIISAFETGHYQIFGETLDIAVGNMIDMVARELDLAHPGGPKIEKLALKSSNYIELPYIVKGMDLSFSGIYTACRKLIKSPEFGNSYTKEDIAFSLQETAFSMLTEVTERALAHTEKREVLLTGGVAANKRLQEMIEYIAKEHDALYHAVPLRLAGDNGAMIAWTGVLYYLNSGEMKVEDTIIQPKYRMDHANIPWRAPDAHFPGVSLRNLPLADKKRTNVYRKGAEAELIKSRWDKDNILIKHRVNKAYRIKQLDFSLRNQRTIAESRSIIRAKQFCVPVPIILDIDLINAAITMSFIEGDRLKDQIPYLKQDELHKIFVHIGKLVAKLHKNDQVHGDLTTSNMIWTPQNTLFFIDFGLSFMSTSDEDKAVDLHLFKRVVTSTHGEYYEEIIPYFLSGYKEEYGIEGNSIIDLMEEVDLRGRYIKKDKRRKSRSV